MTRASTWRRRNAGGDSFPAWGNSNCRCASDGCFAMDLACSCAHDDLHDKTFSSLIWTIVTESHLQDGPSSCRHQGWYRIASITSANAREEWRWLR
jgi:hypothetical protein